MISDRLYQGSPVTISCSAQTSAGLFAGEFMSDGKSPSLFEAGAGTAVERSSIELRQILKDQCDPTSHVAEGPVGEDLTKRRSQFFCDRAAIASFDDDPKHRTISFSESQSNLTSSLSFAGLMDGDDLMTVRNVYLEVGRRSIASEGACRLFLKKGLISSIVCGSKIDEGNRRTVPIVTFTADNAH